MARASAASSDAGSAFGSNTPIIMRICAFSQWPAPTMVFFTRLGAYSATAQPGNGRHQHRDAARLAELERGGGVLVDEGRLDGRFVGYMLGNHALQAVVDRQQPHGEIGALVAGKRAARDEAQAVAFDRHHAPAGAAEPRIDAKDANRATHDRPFIAPAAMPRLVR